MASIGTSSIIHIPTELQTIILAYLEKRDLKNVRLVSKAWCAPATLPLFDKVYVSPRQKDMEVFEEVSRHPVPSTAVREIVYDMSRIREMSYQEYFHDLCLNRAFGVSTSSALRLPDQRLKDWVAVFKTRYSYNKDGTPRYNTDEVLFEEICQEYRKDAFFIEAYHNWKSLAKYESSVLALGEETPLFYRDLYAGMQRLKSLRSFIVRNDIWDTYAVECHESLDSWNLTAEISGSPLARSWNPLHLQPQCLGVPDGDRVFDHFRGITRVLAKLPWHITRFEFCLQLGQSMPVWVLDSQYINEDLQRMSVDSFAHLQDFALRVTTNDWTDYNNGRPLDTLMQMLSSMVHLKRLHLHLTTAVADRENDQYCRFAYEQIFPKNKTWHQLKDLNLIGLSVKGTDLLRLLRVQIPQLRRLKIAAIDLSQGTWYGVTEALHRMNLGKVELNHLSRYTHLGGVVLNEFKEGFRGCGFTDPWMSEAIEKYIANGGRHPLLSYWANDCEVDEWYQEMFPSEHIDGCSRFAHISTCPLFDVDAQRRRPWNEDHYA